MRILLKTVLFFSLVSIAGQAFAQVHLSVNFAPPRARREVVVAAPSAGMTWTAGYYKYNDNDRKYAWQAGRWQAPPAPHQIWVAPRYKRHGDHYDYYEGKWKDNGKHKGR